MVKGVLKGFRATKVGKMIVFILPNSADPDEMLPHDLLALVSTLV